MNQTIASQLSHRTIREFTTDPVPEETMAQIFQVARQTASSRGLQQTAIIRVRDQAKRDALAVIGNQEYVARAPEYLLFIIDAHRSAAILEEMGVAVHQAASVDVFTEAFTDACLMAQNVVVAAESLGFGANYLGNILNDPQGVVDLLGLPKLTFPVVGLTLGMPNQSPQLKPRMDMSLRVMENGYTEPESWLEALSEYDETMQTYYDLREANKKVDSYTNQVKTRLGRPTPSRDRILDTIRAQGFDF